MNILYISTVCSKDTFKQLFDMCDQKPVQQGQKYTNLLLSGLVRAGAKVIALSAYPLSMRNTRKIFFPGKVEYEDGLKYIYCSFINFPILRQMCLLVSMLINMTKALFFKRDNVVIIDTSNTSIALGAFIVSKLLRNNTISIITDIPKYLVENDNRIITMKLLGYAVQKIFEITIHRYDGYICITEEVNKEVNINKRTHIVIEGVSDADMIYKDNTLENKYARKVVMYTGTLHEKFGVKLLADAFLQADISNSECHFYGLGDCSDYLSSLMSANERIKYFGMVHNDIAVDQQMKATLLVNPRFSNEEYTKYSFPSKNMEYMVSGTPTLTTRLSGMPKEYEEYVYLIDDETLNGLARVLNDILAKTQGELHEKGLRAKGFILREKNNLVQGKKIMNMIKEMAGR